MAPNPKPNVELQGAAAVVAIGVVIVCLIAGGGLGWFYGGPLGGLLGTLIGIAIGVVVATVIRARHSAKRFDEPPAPDVRELPPDQAVQILSAMMAANASAAAAESGVRLQSQVQGGLLGELGKARARAESGDLEGALAKLRSLAEAHPRSPAIPTEIVELLEGHEEHRDERLQAATRAMILAVNTGLNRLAKRVHDALDEDERDDLEIPPSAWERLTLVLEAHGDIDAAAASSVRAQIRLDD